MDRDSVAAGFFLLIAFFVSGSCLLRMRVLSVGNYGKWRRICERIVLSLAMLIALAAGAGATFNVLAARHYRALHPAAGRFYAVDGYKMHLYCTGEGSPTIVLDAGLGNDSLIWAKVQPELSKQPGCAPMIARDSVGATRNLARTTLSGLPTNCIDS
jgi:hypothetical protein